MLIEILFYWKWNTKTFFINCTSMYIRKEINKQNTKETNKISCFQSVSVLCNSFQYFVIQRVLAVGYLRKKAPSKIESYIRFYHSVISADFFLRNNFYSEEICKGLNYSTLLRSTKSHALECFINLFLFVTYLG